MAEPGSGTRSTLARAARSVTRRWVPFVGVATVVFVFTAVIGATVGSERRSPLLPVPDGATPFAGLSATELFVHNLGVAGWITLGVLLFGLPTLYLLGFNGFLFGAGMVEFAGTFGPARTLAMVLPHAVLELPALLLAGGIAFRWCYLGWRIATATRDRAGIPRTLVETLLALLAVVLLLALAALVEAHVSAAVARALT